MIYAMYMLIILTTSQSEVRGSLLSVSVTVFYRVEKLVLDHVHRSSPSASRTGAFVCQAGLFKIKIKFIHDCMCINSICKIQDIRTSEQELTHTVFSNSFLIFTM